MEREMVSIALTLEKEDFYTVMRALERAAKLYYKEAQEFRHYDGVYNQIISRKQLCEIVAKSIEHKVWKGGQK